MSEQARAHACECTLGKFLKKKRPQKMEVYNHECQHMLDNAKNTNL